MIFCTFFAPFLHLFAPFPSPTFAPTTLCCHFRGLLCGLWLFPVPIRALIMTATPSWLIPWRLFLNPGAHLFYHAPRATQGPHIIAYPYRSQHVLCQVSNARSEREMLLPRQARSVRRLPRGVREIPRTPPLCMTGLH